MKLEIDGLNLLFTGDADGKEREDPGTVPPGHVDARLLGLPAGSLLADVLRYILTLPSPLRGEG